MGYAGVDNGEINRVILGHRLQRAHCFHGIAQVKNHRNDACAAGFAFVGEVGQARGVPAVQDQGLAGTGIAPRQCSADTTRCARDQYGQGILPDRSA